jgi:hypothetical protein
MKTFYTERDIVDMHRAGVTEIVVDESVVLTDLAREKATDLGIKLNSQPDPPPPPSASVVSAPPPSPPAPPDLVATIKARVIARLGTTEYNKLLEQVITQVLAHLSNTQISSPPTSSPSKGNDY